MSPEFASTVDPIFNYVLTALDQIETRQIHTHHQVDSRVRGLLERAGDQFGARPDWALAKYAIVAWIDELLIEDPWPGSTWWKENRLEKHFFNTSDADITFFSRAIKAAESSGTDALEVFYLCVVLGFKGIYGQPDAARRARDLGLPLSLDHWTQSSAKAIQSGQHRPVISNQETPGPGAPPLEGQYLVIGTGLVTVLLFAIFLATVSMAF